MLIYYIYSVLEAISYAIYTTVATISSIERKCIAHDHVRHVRLNPHDPIHRGPNQPDDVHISVCAWDSVSPGNGDSPDAGRLLYSTQLFESSDQGAKAAEFRGWRCRTDHGRST